MQSHVSLLITYYIIFMYILTFVDDHTEAGQEVEEAVKYREVE